jgi:hypothetical protein
VIIVMQYVSLREAGRLSAIGSGGVTSGQLH